MDKKHVSKIGNFLGDATRCQDMFNYMKVLMLQYVPRNEDQSIRDVLEKNDIDRFMVLLKQYVPDLESKLINYINNYSNGD